MTDLTSVGIPRPKRIVTGFSNISGFMAAPFSLPRSCGWMKRGALETLPALDHVLADNDGCDCNLSRARVIRFFVASFAFRLRRFLTSTTKFFAARFFIADALRGLTVRFDLQRGGLFATRADSDLARL